MTFSSATTSAERAPPPNRAISPKVSPGPNDAHRDLETLGVEQLAFLRGAQPARPDAVAAIDPADHAAHISAIVEGVQLELVGAVLANLDAAHAVALRIERGE